MPRPCTRPRACPGTLGVPTRRARRASRQGRATDSTRFADGTPDAARRQRAHLPRLLRPPAALDREGRARQRRVRVHLDPPARLPGREAGLRRGRLRPPRARRSGTRSSAEYKATRKPMPDDLRVAVPEGPGGRRGPPDPRPRARRLRGGRRHRDPHAPGGGTRDRLHRRDGRPRHAPDRERPGPPHDHSAGGPEHGLLRPRHDPRAVRAGARADGRLQGAQGRLDRQHPRHPRGGGEDRGEAHRRLRRPRHALLAARRGEAGEAARSRSRHIASRSTRAATSRRSSATSRSSSTTRPRGLATTTARPSSVSSASSSSARSSTGSRGSRASPSRMPSRPHVRRGPAGWRRHRSARHPRAGAAAGRRRHGRRSPRPPGAASSSPSTSTW